MKVKFYIIVAVLVTLAVFSYLWDSSPQSIPSVQAAEPLQTTRQGAWLDSMVFTKQENANQAVAQLQANDLDVYAQPLADPTLFQTVLEGPNLTQTESYGSYNELTFNPHGPTFYDGRLNPFSNAKIREAMNWLIDRNKIAQEIFGGMAVPKWLPLLHIDTDYTRFQGTIEALEAQYAYNFSQAQITITTEMEGMGAYLENGTWHYNGEPVTVIFLIRVEDQRRQIGDYVADQLEAIGFMVDRQYKTRPAASLIWNQSDPAEGQWHIYTGGWISTNISRDDATNFGFFYTPRGGGSPLWQAYNPTPEYDALCESLWVNDFSTMEERATLFEQALAMAMSDSGPGSQGAGSARVWLVDQISFSPRRTGTIVASDLAGGLQSADMFPYVARFEGVEGGSLRIAQQDVLTDPWNPIAGSSWLYDMLPQRATEDRGLMIDPNTGLYWPLRIDRADVVVQAGLPITKTLDWVTLTTTDTILVPDDAWVDWDATNQVFITAGEKYTQTLTANSKVTVHYPTDLFTTVTWHDGSPLSVGDFIMDMIMRFDPAKPDSLIYDESQVPNLEAFLSHFKGLVIESTDPLVITTYDDQWYLDAEWMVQTWFPAGGSYAYGTAPWHSLATAIRAEQAGQLAFSSAKAGQLGVVWTNFIGGPSLDILETWMNQSASEHYIPYALTMGNYVTTDEVTARWAALQAWYTVHHHFWLGTGPFYVQQVSSDPKYLTLAHNDAYPDAAGRWDAFAAPAQPEIVINHTSGAPGSFFNVTVTGFPPDSLATIVANNHILDQQIVDSGGTISFTLSTEQATPGEYHLRVSVNPAAGVEFLLNQAQPLQPRVGDLPVIVVPGGMITYYTHLPLVTRNYSPEFLYFDDFSNPNSGWYTGGGDNYSYSYQDGEYQISATQSGWIVSSGAPISSMSGSYSVEADIRRAGGIDSEYGIYFENDYNYFSTYMFNVKPETQTYALWSILADNSWIMLSAGTSNYINPGDGTNHLKADRNGSQITISVNGHILASVTDTYHIGGVCGLQILSHDGLPAIARFDNFEVRRLPGNLTGSLTPAEGQRYIIPAYIPEADHP